MDYCTTLWGVHLDTGGTFDYQWESNKLFGYIQHSQFRDISNFNVGLYLQQAGISEDKALSIAGQFATRSSKNAHADMPYGLDADTAKFIRIGYEAGETGEYGPPVPRHSR